MILRGLFRRVAESDVNATALRQVKALARSALGPAAETTLAANEIVCADPSCPGVETVILIMAPGQKTRALKIAKAAAEVTEQDIRDALSAAGSLS